VQPVEELLEHCFRNRVTVTATTGATRYYVGLGRREQVQEWDHKKRLGHGGSRRVILKRSGANARLAEIVAEISRMDK